MSPKSTLSRRRRQPKLSATVNDVAKAAGVSTASVSRALKRPLLVSEGTRARVLEAANLLSYPGGAAPSAVDRRAPHLVGALFGRGMDDSRLGQVVGELEGGLHGAGIVLCVAKAGTDSLVVAERLVAAGAALLITHGITVAEAECIGLRLKVPCVACGEYEIAAADRARSRRIAVEYLTWLGHRDIALVGPREEHFIAGADVSNRGIARVRYASLQQAGVLIDGLALARMSRPSTEYPTGLICDTDASAASLIRRSRAAGLVVPNDISIIGTGNTSACYETDPPMTSVRWQPMTGAERAAFAIACIREGASGVTSNMNVKLVVRRSTARAPE